MKFEEKFNGLEARTIKKNTWMVVLLGLFIICLSSINVFAWSTNQFNNSLTNEVLFFTGNQNITRYLSIPNTVSYLTAGQLNLSGFVGLLDLPKYYYAFENNLENVSGIENLTVNKGQIDFLPGKNGNAGNFSSTQSMNVSYSAEDQNWNFTRQTTLNFWMNQKSSVGNQALMNKRSGNGWYVEIQTTTAFNVGGLSPAVLTTTVPSLNNWHMITIVRNSTNMSLWKDGVLVDYDSISVPSTSGINVSIGDGTTVGDSNFVGLIDEMGVWDIALDSNAISALYASGAGMFYPFTEINITNMYIGGTTISDVTIAANGTIPTTITISNLASIVNLYLNSTYLVGSNYLIPFIFHSDNAGNLTYSAMNFSNEGFIENSQTYTATTTSGTVEYFSINITYDSSTYSAISPVLFYNSTAYAPFQTLGSGNNLIFNASITIPTITGSTSKTFNWIFTLTNSSGSTFVFNSTSKTQTINPLQVDNCTLYSTNILNFTLFDEDDRTKLNGTIELDVTFYSAGTSIIVGNYNNSYAFTTSSGAARVCMNQTNASLVMDYHAKYYSNVSLYPVEHKFAQNLSVTNTTQVVNLYDLLDARSTVFQITLQSADLDRIDGAVIDILREYVPIGQFISVESPLTDRYGSTVGHFVENEVYYTFVISKGGQILATFDRQLVKCQNVVTGDCRLTLNLIDATQNAPDFRHYGNISVGYFWSPSIRRLLTTWQSADGTHLVQQNVTLMDGYGNTTICGNSANGQSGTFTCTIPDSYGNTTIISYLYSDGKFLGAASFNLGDSANSIFGGTKVVLGMLMYSTITLMFIASPIMIVIGALLGMGFMVAFHIVDGGSFIGNSSIFFWFIIAGGIIIYQIAKKPY